MKRLTALLLIALTTLPLAGCDVVELLSATPTPVPEKTIAPTPTPLPTPAPTPTPTPVPVVEIEDYAYETLTNKTLGVSFAHPSHWINHPGKITISFAQPANPGQIGARMAVSVKKISKTLNTNGVIKQLEQYSDTIGAQFEQFEAGSISKKTKFMGSTALSCTYDAQLDGQPVKGYVIMTYKKSRKRLIALHFYASADSYDAFSPVLKKIHGSVKLA